MLSVIVDTSFYRYIIKATPYGGTIMIATTYLCDYIVLDIEATGLKNK